MNEKKNNSFSGFGVGYVSVMMIFAVICLTILAVLSFHAADSGNALTERNAAFTAEYYAADAKAKQLLMKLDEAAFAGHQSSFFEDDFPALVSGYDGVSVTPVPDGFRVSYDTAINDRLSLSSEIIFYTTPLNGRRYDIIKWSSSSPDTQDSGPALWDGEF